LGIEDLEVRRPSPEDIHLAMVRNFEAGRGTDAVRESGSSVATRREKAMRRIG
jgi:hypothetical protein